mgnify:FL=1
MTIADVLKQPDKAMLVQPITAKVTEVGQRKTGEGQYGPWSVQQLLLEDITGKIRAACWNRDDLAALKGETVVVSARKGDKGWMGCQVKDNVFKGNDGEQKMVKQIDLKADGVIKSAAKPAPTAPQSQEAPKQPATSPQMALPGAISFWEYLQTMELVHGSAMALEPNDGQARAALVNTAMIAVVSGKLKLPPDAPREPGEPGSDDDDPFKG